MHCNWQHDQDMECFQGECVKTFEGHNGVVSSIVLMQDGKLCSGSYDGSIKVWNVQTGNVRRLCNVLRMRLI